MKNKVIKYLKYFLKVLKQPLRIRSIQFVITVSFAFITVLAIVFIGVLLSGKYTKTAEQNVGMNTIQIIDQVNMNLDYYQKNMMEISSLLESSINKNPKLPNKKLEEQMDVILDIRDDIVAIAVFTNNGELVLGNPFSKLKSDIVVEEQDWFKEASRGLQGIFFSVPHVQNLFPFKHNWVVSLSRPISFNYNGISQEGILLVDMNFRSIAQVCEKVSLGRRGYIYITDYEGNLIYHPQQQLIYAGIKKEDNNSIKNKTYGSFIQDFQGERRLITVKTVGYTSWKIIGVSYLDEVVTSKKDITRFSGWIIFFGVIFVITVFIFISAKITQPIKLLDKSMKKVEEGSLDVFVDIKGEEEIVHLSKTFNMMLLRIRQLMDQVVLEQEAKRKSELNALQAQINPHFLYNTLDSIVWMAENGKSQDVITMVTALARLFRISISRGKNIITVKDELEHARNYLIIQKIRYKNKFQFTIEAEDEVLNYKTLKLILQPIIENAIYHGIEYMVDEGNIKITARIFEDMLIFEVIDNGLGMSEEKLKSILSPDSADKGGNGVGVKNVHERVRLCFGKQYGVEIKSELEVGTKVSIMIPLVENESQVLNA
jgi:two-component system sensor histidine kinase YesM